MKKMCYVVNARFPTEKAHGLQIAKTCEALTQQGVDLTLVVPRRRNKWAKEDPFVFFDIKTPFKIVRVPTIDLIFLGKIGYLIESFIFTFFAWLYVMWVRPDVVHGRDEKQLFPFLIGPWKVVYEVHRGRRRKLAQYMQHKADGLVVITHKLKTFFSEMGIDADKIYVATDAVDVQRFDIAMSREEARTKLDLPQDKKIVLYTGSLFVRKGVDTLAQAAEELSDDTLVFFVGGTDEMVADFKKKYGHIRNIVITGQKLHEEIPIYLKAADMLVIPNSAQDETAREFTSPMKLFEYMASGTPIVSSDVSAIREVLDDESCFFVTADDPQTLSETILSVLQNEEEALQKAQEAYILVQSYTWEGRGNIIKECIHKI